MAHRLPGRVSRAHPHPPDLVRPSAVFFRPVSAPIPHLRANNHSLRQTRARNALHPPILRRPHAALEHFQKLGPLLASRWRKHRLLDLPAVRSGGRAI